MVDYKHSEFMRREEEGSWRHAKIRQQQLQDVIAANERVWGEPESDVSKRPKLGA